MTYLQTHNRGGFARNRGLWGGVSVLVVVIILIELIVPHFLPAIFTTIARPFWRMEFSVESGSLRSPEYLLNQNEELKRELADMNIRLQTTQAVSDENDQLKALLKRPVASSISIATLQASTTTPVDTLANLKPSPYTLAAVLKRPPIAPYDELVIDIGSSDGVTVGNQVYASGNVLIGQVSDVLGQTSKVALYSSPNMTYDVLITDNSVGSTTGGIGKNTIVPAVAHGLGGGQFSVQVPRDVVASAGDVVTVPSISGKTIGVVGAVIMDPAQPFETILFTSLTNIYDLRWVLVDTRVDSMPAAISAASVRAPVTKNVKK